MKYSFLFLLLIFSNFVFSQMEIQEEKPAPQLKKEEKAISHVDFKVIHKVRHLIIASDKETEKWGVVTKDFETILPFEFDSIAVVHKRIWVRKNSLEGYFDFEGEELMPIKYTDLSTQIFVQLYLVSGKLDGVSGFFELKKQSWHPIEFDSIVRTYRKYIRLKKGEKEGLISYPDFKILLPFEYDQLSPSKIRSDEIAFVKNEGKQGIVNMKNEFIIPLEYEKIEFPFDFEGHALVEKNGKQGILSLENKILLPLEYDFIKRLGSKYMVEQSGMFGVLGYQKQMILPFKYSEINQNMFEYESTLKKRGLEGEVIAIGILPNGEKEFIKNDFKTVRF